MEAVYSYTEGHAYVMRVIMGEIQKDRRYVPPKQVMSKRLDIVDAVFERSFTRLSDAGRIVFLCVANWKSALPELGLIVVLSQLGIDVEHGLEECLRLSLISAEELADGQPAYSAPALARLFGSKKFQGDPDRLLIQEHLDLLRQFGVVTPSNRHLVSQDEAMTRFLDWVVEPEREDEGLNASKVDHLLETVAEFWPKAWLPLARHRERVGAEQEEVEYALRRASEELPSDTNVWTKRAEYAERVGDPTTRIASLVSLVDANPSDLPTALRVAGELTRYVSSHKAEITKARRGVYLASVRAHLEKQSPKLDADGLSRLAWLFLLEEDRGTAAKYATLGLQKDPANPYCRNVLEKSQ